MTTRPDTRAPAEPTLDGPGAHTAGPAAARAPSSRRKPALLAVTAVVVVAALAWGVYWGLVLRHHESTDNAYVQAPLVQVTPQLGGTVLAVLADDTDRVRAGQPLVVLDPADARLALERAQAQLAQTVREVRTLYVANGSLAATLQLRQADAERARSDVARRLDDVERRRPLLASGAVGGEEMKHAEAALAAARSALAAAEAGVAGAREQAAGNSALTEGVALENHPSVERAAAAVREAHLALQRTELRAPVAGQVARRNVQVGQRIAAGTPLMSVVPLERAWVEANFKEGQLRRMRIGQPVTLHADLYGSTIAYRGRIAGLGAGTGSAFALLPAQNATGNWIKVVQRVPVRVELDAAELAARPLRVGLSMEATVDVTEQAGAPVVAGGPARSEAAVVGAADTTAADGLVREIIASNLGRAVHRVAASAATAPQRAPLQR